MIAGRPESIGPPAPRHVTVTIATGIGASVPGIRAAAQADDCRLDDMNRSS